MRLHHAKLKAAVGKYGPLLTEGKTPEEIKAAIGADEKAFTPEEVDEIYAAIALADKPGDSDEQAHEAKGHVVISEFRDKDDFSKRYAEGDDVSHFDEYRKADLVNRKLIKAI